MRVLVLCFFLLALIAVNALELEYEESLYTPAELRRNEARRKFGIPLSPPRKLNAKAAPPEKEKELRPDVEDGAMKHFEVPPSFKSKGHIGIHKDDVNGPRIGWVACHKLVKSRENAILYSFAVSGPVMEINMVDSDQRMAVTTGLFGSNLSPLSKNFHLARHTRFSSIPGAGPGHDKEQAYLYETNVFSYDPDSGEIDVQWVNIDGSYAVTEIAIMNDRIYYTGDLNEFRAFTNMKVDRVAFKWYPLDKS